jgi:phosphoribosylanthranilate isomerase
MAVGAKICGLNDAAGLDAALRHGARMIGFNAFPPSPRYVVPDQLAALAARVPGHVERVGVMVDPDDATLETWVRAGRLSIVQFHGHEPPERLQAVRERFGVAAMKVIRVAEAADLDGVAAYEQVADWLMFDAKPPREATRPGGNAVAFDWQLLAGRSLRRPWLLAGGLDATNVKEAVALSGARLVDVSSGVESAPGVKDPALIRAFLETVRDLV